MTSNLPADPAIILCPAILLPFCELIIDLRKAVLNFGGSALHKVLWVTGDGTSPVWGFMCEFDFRRLRQQTG